MDRNRTELAQRLALALSPAGVLILVLALADVVPVGPALAAVAMAAGGAIWFLSAASPPADSPEPQANTVADGPPASVYHVLDPLPDPVLVLDEDRTLLAANRAARDLFGIGTPGLDLTKSIRHPAVLAAVETILSGVPAITEEIVLPVPVPRTFTMHAARIDSPDTPPEAALIIALHDETRARRAERSRADFVANASHELRSPLSALIGFIETLRGPARGDLEAQERFLGIMRREAFRMAGLIDDLLSLSRVEINEHVPPREHVDLAPLLESVASTLAGRAADRDMDIRVVVPAATPPVQGDRDQLSQVFHNLIDNAIKYGHQGTPIHMTARSVERVADGSGPGVAVTVADQSDGIPSMALPRITERFYRIDDGRSRMTGGTGLGLAIVKHIVNRHRGRLKIESRIGEGSEFTVYLPIASDAESPKRGTELS